MTIAQLLGQLLPEHDAARCPVWPPDVYGVVATLLRASGGYAAVSRSWPPAGASRGVWYRSISDAAFRWRHGCADGNIPAPVREWWRILWAARSRPVAVLSSGDKLCAAVLQLASVADQASANAGIPVDNGDTADDFDAAAGRLLSLGNTLGIELDRSRLRIVPKLHTPQNGLTIRSLSHHLAAYEPGEIEVRWQTVWSRPGHSINLLLLPWPLTLDPVQFTSEDTSSATLPAGFGCFSFDPPRHKALRARLRAVLRDAEKRLGSLDGIVMPELSLTQEQHRIVRDEALRHDCFLVSGVHHDRKGSQGPRNAVHVDVPLGAALYTSSVQFKHHRWLLSRGQIVQYGLGARLDPEMQWWENTEIRERAIDFVAMRPWLTMCALVCEDLARQEPAAEVVRAIGPNLVIVLLMDGPQLPERWSARYATVLADDPGCSVLTLTSLGMSLLCRAQGKQPSRAISLWKDAATGQAVPIELPAGAAGVVLSLTVQYRNEWSADGREDGGATGYPTLAGIHPVFERPGRSDT